MTSVWEDRQGGASWDGFVLAGNAGHGGEIFGVFLSGLTQKTRLRDDKMKPCNTEIAALGYYAERTNIFSQYPAPHHGEAENGGGWRCLATSAKRKGEAGRHPHHHHKFHSGERHTITPRHAENSSFMYRVSESLPTPSCHPSDISRPSILPAFQNPVKLSSSIHSHGPWSSITFSSSKSRIIGPVPPFTLPSPPSIGLSNLSSPSRYPPSPPP